VPESDEDLARRVAALEEAVRRLDEQGAVSAADSAAARVLASGADRDVSEVRAELRAHTQALNALRETQREQGDALRDGFAKVNTTLQRIVDVLDPEQH
jgi:nitrogen-specific signal transduction histidine kinase